MSISAEARLVRPLYRALIRLAGAFDREPAARLMIHAKETNQQSLYSEAVSDFLGGKHRFYLAPGSDALVTEVVRRFFRLPLSEGATVDERVDAAFLAVRELSSIWHQALTHIVSPRLKQRKDEAQAAWLEQEEDQQQEEQTPLKLSKAPQPQAKESVTPLPVKEANSVSSGVLLLAHPLIAGSIFQRSVVLLVQHHSSRGEDGEGATEERESPLRPSKKGTYGLIVNKLSGFDLKHAVKGGLKPDFFKAFSACPVRLGGPVPRLQMLHRHEAVGGVAVQGKEDKLMVSGDVDQASRLVLSGDAPAEDFNFFAGACTWAPGQLEEEIERGYWILVEAPPALSVEFRPQLWREVLLGLGGTYKLSADLPESVLPRLVEPSSGSS